MIPCIIEGEGETNFSVPELQNCGVTLTSTDATLSVTDANPAPNRLYQFYVNGGLAGSPQASTQRPVSGLPSDGSTIDKEVRYSDDGGNTFVVGDTCTCTAVDQTTNFSVPALDNCNITLTSDAATLSVTDASPAPNRLYQFYVNGGVAGAPQTSTQRPVSGLATDGSTITKSVDYSDDGGNTFQAGDTCTCTAFTATVGAGDLTPVDGTKIESSSTTFTAMIPAGSGATAADLYIVDSNGTVVFDGPSGPIDANGNFTITASGYPLDESTFTVFVDYFDFLPSGTKLGTISGMYTACDDVVVQPDKVMSFADIETNARARLGPNAKLHFEEDIDWAGEFLIQNLLADQGCPYYDVDMGAQTVTGFDEPEPDGNVTLLPPPSGGDDTNMIQNALSTGARVQGTGQQYRTDGIVVNNSDVRVWDVPLRPINGLITFWTVNGADFRVYRSPMDAENLNSVRSGVKSSNRNTHVIKSGLINTFNTLGGAGSDTTGAGFWAEQQASGFYLAMNEWRDLRNNSTGSTNRANPVLVRGNQIASKHGQIVANTANNCWSQGTLRDSDFVTFQDATSYGGQDVLVLGNNAENYGKRFGKHQDSTGVRHRSNVARNTIADTASVNRGRLNYSSLQPFFVGDAGGVDAYNNLWTMEVQDNYTAFVRQTVPNDSRRIYKNIHFECNLIQMEASPTGNFDYYGFSIETNSGNDDVGAGLDGADLEHASVSYADNVWQGGGDLYYCWRNGWGYSLANGLYDRSGNVFGIPHTAGLEKKD